MLFFYILPNIIYGMTTMYKTILQKKMLFVWMMFTVNAPAIESLKTTYVWKVDDIYKKIPVLYNIYKVMQRCNWYEKLHMKFVPCPEQFISQKVQAILTMQCTAMKWNPLFVCSRSLSYTKVIQNGHTVMKQKSFPWYSMSTFIYTRQNIFHLQ